MKQTIKTRDGRVLVMPTPEEDAQITADAMSDPDAMPFTDEEWEKAKPTAQRGRPLGSGSKVQITLRLDTDLVAKFKASGAGWQTRINDLLRDAVARGRA